MHKVNCNGKIYFAGDGQLLSQVLMNNSIAVEHSCGGKGLCKKCAVTVNGKDELSCAYKVYGDIIVTLKDKNKITVNSYSNVISDEEYCYCLDVGTTTLALSLVSLDRKCTVKSAFCQNPQRLFGADVISRINYSAENGVKPLQKSLISEINNMICALGNFNTKKLYASGNTTMLHTLFGEECSGMGVYPYKPRFLQMRTEKGESLGIEKVDVVVSLPSIHAFIGADVVAGLGLLQKPQKNKYSILVDLGTNAEIVLFSSKKYICTSAAAGPCFEGVSISCGMSAVDGAIYSYLPGQVKTIGNKEPLGICGTGIIDLCAHLLRTGKADSSGLLAESFKITEEIAFTQEDLRQLQLSKSAIYSAITVLIKRENISLEDIDYIYISGGFSEKINIRNALCMGLLPEFPKERVIPLGNSSLEGTVKYALEGNNLEKICQNAEYVDLSQTEEFSQLFIENMSFKNAVSSK